MAVSLQIRIKVFMKSTYHDIIRSSRQEVFWEKGVLENFTKFTGKHLCQSLFFNKVTGLGAATLLKKRLWQRRFPMNFVKFFSAPFLQNTLTECFCQRRSLIFEPTIILPNASFWRRNLFFFFYAVLANLHTTAYKK